MTTIKTEHVRTTGRRLTYDILADEWGGYSVLLQGKELLRGKDPLSAHGQRRAPNKRKAVGGVALAKQAIESLRDMNEI